MDGFPLHPCKVDWHMIRKAFRPQIGGLYSVDNYGPEAERVYIFSLCSLYMEELSRKIPHDKTHSCRVI